LYLWQIRHIPIRRQSFYSFTSRLGLLLLLAGLANALTRPAVGQGDAKSAPETKSAKDSTASLSADQAAATAFMAKVHDALKSHPSVRADIEQTVTIGSQPFRATGRYMTSGSKLRLEYLIKPNEGADGSLIEVCDGKQLWSQVTLNGVKRVTHRDVEQIKAAVASTKNISDAVVSAELGLGGLTALLASLERTMIFEAMKEGIGEGQKQTVIQGQWKVDISNRWRRRPEDPLPAYIPDLVRVVVDSRTLFPERIIYLKKQTEKEQTDKEKTEQAPAAKDKSAKDVPAKDSLAKTKKGYRAIVSLTFQNVQLDASIDEQEFTFVPPEDVVPEDITRQYLDRITKSKEAEAAAPAGSPASIPRAK